MCGVTAWEYLIEVKHVPSFTFKLEECCDVQSDQTICMASLSFALKPHYFECFCACLGVLKILFLVTFTTRPWIAIHALPTNGPLSPTLPRHHRGRKSHRNRQFQEEPK